MSDTYHITIKNMKTNEERQALIHANSWYVALVKFANQITMGVVAKLVPGVNSGNTD